MSFRFGILTFLILFSFLNPEKTIAQSDEIDSLKYVYKSAQKDTTKLSVLINIGIAFRSGNLDSSDAYLDKAILKASKGKHLYYELKALNESAWNISKNKDYDKAVKDLVELKGRILELLSSAKSKEKKQIYLLICDNIRYTGHSYRKKGDFVKAIEQYEMGLAHAVNSKNYKNETGFYNDLAQTFYMQGQYPKSLEYCLKGIEVNKANKDEEGTASATGNAGIIFKEMGDYKKAIQYFQKALKLNKKLGNRESVAINLGNIGVGYGQLGEIEKSIEYYLQAAEIHVDLDDQEGLLYNYTNLGIEYTKLKKYDVALEYFKYSLEILEKFPDDYTASFTYTSIASTYIQQGKYKEGFIYLEKARLLAEKMNAMDQMMDNYKMQIEYYSAIKNPKKELEFYKLYIKYRDTIRNEESMRNLIQQEENFKYQQKVSRDSILNAQAIQIRNSEMAAKNAEIDKNNAELKSNQFFQYLLFGGLALVLFFAFFMYNRFKVSQKQNTIIQKQKQQVEIQKKDIEFQKNLVDVKQKEIIDSINYAQKIQRAILSTEEDIKKYLPHTFLYYQPKDIVAGDFYFFEVTDTHIFMAAADCTGHGVPGALMSVVCSNALTRCVKEFNISDPGKILDKTRELVLETLRKSGSDLKDGMDISFATLTYGARNENESDSKVAPISHSILALSWSGANNPLWYLKDGKMHEISADKQSIGQNYNPKPFTTHSLPLSLSAFFLFTDGYADQFGGPEGKKFKYSQLQKLLVENGNLESSILNKKLSQTFFAWKGDLEQVDDVCVIGVRI